MDYIEKLALTRLRQQIQMEQLTAQMVQNRVETYFANNPQETHLHLNISALVPNLSSEALPSVIVKKLATQANLENVYLDLESFDLDVDRKCEN